MELLVVDGATLTTGNPLDKVTITPPPASLVSSRVFSDGNGAYHSITFVVTLADGSTGGGVLIGNSEYTKGGVLKFVLGDAELADVPCTLTPPGTVTPVDISVDNAGQTEVKFD